MPITDELILRMRAVGGAGAAADVDAARGAVGGLGHAAKFAAGIAGLGALSFGLEDITKTAIRFQQQQQQLAGALRNMGQYSAENMKQLTESADTLATHGGFDPGTNLEGLTRLITAHVGVTQAIKDETLVTDIARRAHLPYQTALRAVTIVEQGRTTGLARLGIVLPKVTTAVDALTASHKKLTPAMRAQAKEQDAQASKTAALQELWRRFGGAVQDYSKGAAGAISNFRNSIDVLLQRLGVSLLPLITKIATGLSGLIRYFEGNKTAAIALASAIGAVGALWIGTKIAAFVGWLQLAAKTMGLLTIATWAQSAAETAAIAAMYAFDAALGVFEGLLDAIGIGEILALIGLIIGAIVLLVTHFHQVAGAVKDAFGWIVRAATDTFGWLKHAVSDVLNWIKGHWKLIIAILLGPLGLAIDAIVTHWNAIKRPLEAVLSFIGGVATSVFHAIAGAASWAADTVLNVFRTLSKLVVSVATTLWTILTWPFREVIRIAGTIWHAIEGPLASLAHLVQGAMNALWNILTWPFREAINFAKTLWSWIQKLAGPLKSLAHFGGGVLGGIGSGLSSAAHFFGLQSGGEVRRGGVFDVGERGRERIFLPSGSVVVPHAFANTGLAQDSGGDQHLYLVVDSQVVARATNRGNQKRLAVT